MWAAKNDERVSTCEAKHWNKAKTFKTLLDVITFNVGGTKSG